MVAQPPMDRLEQLRRWRVWPDPDLSLSFLSKKFKKKVVRPHKQMGEMAHLWLTLVPAKLAQHTRLDGLTRGVLHVKVDSSARLYELDRLLRCGLQNQLIAHCKGPALRRVQLRVGRLDGD